MWALCCGDGKDRAERHPTASCQLLFQELALSLLATYAKERCLGLILGYSYNDNSEQQLQMENLPFKQIYRVDSHFCSLNFNKIF